jgi:cytochrome oxidase Cu insertion factor (SCO1/SenC/PrrC family)
VAHHVHFSAMMQMLLRSATMALASVILVTSGCAKHVELHGTQMYTLAPELPLHDIQGNAFSYRNLHGTIAVLFFGYTHCPDVCPTTLARLAQSLHQMSLPQRNRIKVYFVSVDPARDSLPITQRYVTLFDPSFIALSGTTQQLDLSEKNYHVWAQRLPARPGSANYEVAHSSAVFISDGSGNIAEILSWDSSAAIFAADLKALVSAL